MTRFPHGLQVMAMIKQRKIPLAGQIFLVTKAMAIIDSNMELHSWLMQVVFYFLNGSY